MRGRLIQFLRRGPRHVVTRMYYEMRAPKAQCYSIVAEAVSGRGLEVGGPSPIFAKRGLLPIYPHVRELDNCNFAAETVWEGHLEEGLHFRFGDRTGYQYVSEAWSINVPDASYDFVLSSHMLEHSANPVRVLGEWRRILKPGGHLVLVLPEGSQTFDRRRPVTTLQHLLDDYRNSTPESDATHFDEIAELHVERSDRDKLRKSLDHNFKRRTAHHHVFDMALALDIVRAAGFRAVANERQFPCHLIVLAQKPVLERRCRSNPEDYQVRSSGP